MTPQRPIGSGFGYASTADDVIKGIDLTGKTAVVWCAVSPRLDGLGGVYCEDVEVASLAPADQADSIGLSDAHTKRGVMPFAVEPESAERLWKLSEALV
jgi:hypothetical protein